MASNLTLEQTKAFEDILETLNSAGWKHLLKFIEKNRDAAADVRNCTDLAFSKGQVSVYDTLASAQEIWTTLYDGAREGQLEVEEWFGK